MDSDYLAAQAAHEHRNYADATRLLQSHLERAPHDGRAWEFLGLVHSARGGYAESVSALEQASLLVPLKTDARICLGYAYGKIGRTQLSRDLLIAMIDDPSLSAESLLQVAAGLDALNAPEHAVRACRAAAAVDSSLAQAYYDLGYYSARCGRPPELTISLAGRAISIDPSNVSYRIGLSSLLCKLNRDGEAYCVVRELTQPQLETIRCLCCLERIARLYESSSDYRRAVLCRRQLLKLEAKGYSHAISEETI
jgi:tetratricopeptide (TPR) repeat protein